ncbi:MAG TPA: choice-of-anchor D domain-containing protein [Gemmatimonadota bacterium]|nr:choice-of-anchor D domain-containing protein [Gemmatimonadota bacterium]
MIRIHRSRLAPKLGVAAVAMAALACAGSERDEVPQLVADPDTLAFESLAVGRVSPARVVIWSNESADTVRVSDLVVSGPAAADFVLAEDLCGRAALAPRSTCSVAVLFGPRETGIRQATLAAGGGSEAMVTLRGTGSGGGTDVPGVTGLVRAVPETLDFGEQPVGTPSGPLGVRLVNQGQGPVQFAVRVQGGVTSGFRIALDRCSNEILRPGWACTVQVLLEPVTEGLLTGELVLRDLNGQRDQAVPLAGTGIVTGPEVVVDGGVISPLASLSVSVVPRAIEFGVHGVGATSPARAVRIRNDGAASVTFRSLEVAGAAARDFRIAGSDCGGGLVPTRTCSIEIVFEPSGAGPRTGRVEARTDTGLEPALVLLGGTGEVR